MVARTDPEKRISYSRRKQFYSEAPRYRATAYTYANVVRTVDTFAAAGLIEHDRAPPGRLGYQSTFRAASSLVSHLGSAAMPVVYAPAETILLRDDNGDALDYRDTDRTRAIRKRLRTINEAIGSSAVAHPELGTVADGDPLRLGQVYTGPASRKLHRVFTRDFSHHGRFYGAWWQALPKRERKRLSLGGEAAYEADFPRLHITLAYAEAGVPLEGDPYDLPPWPTTLVKVAVNIVLNAKGHVGLESAGAEHRRARGIH